MEICMTYDFEYVTYARTRFIKAFISNDSTYFKKYFIAL